MTLKREQDTFQVLLTNRFHQAAQAFYPHHADAVKAKQVYLNTLSVQAVRFYLNCLGIHTSLEQSESWNPVLQVLADIADLWVDDHGRLECRPVLPGESVWKVPLEVLTERIGYVFVQFNAALTEATLLGFLPQLTEASVTLEQLQPLEEFPVFLSRLPQPLAQPSSSTSMARSLSRVALRPWLTHVVEAGWTSLEQLIADWQSPEPALSFRAPAGQIDLIEPPTVGAKQGKFLSLGDRSEEQVLLIIGIAPAPSSVTFNITVELYPTGREVYLPPSLQLSVMDEDHIPVLQAEGRQSQGLEFQFSGEPGECFTVQVSLNQVILTELFEL